MFENFKNLASVLGQAKQAQEKFEALQAELAHKTVEADAGAGAVRVVANGKMEIISVRLDRAMLAALAGPGEGEQQALDQKMVEDLITAATNAALAKARDAIQGEIGRLAGGLNLPAMGEMLGLNKP